MSEQIQNAMRRIPSMDKILSLPWISEFEQEIGRDAVKAIISALLSEYRKNIIQDNDMAFDADSIAKEARNMLAAKAYPTLKRVVNATGVIIHTNLGRSLLASDAIKAVQNVAGNYSTLEYSVEEGTRGHRNSHVEWLLCRLTGAEAAIVVNNNASAVILSLVALAKGKEAIVSRGELVEIGGSFRIPDIMDLSGAKTVEVGTTNRTHLYDYESAINENTAMLLKIHPSNFTITGFSSSVDRRELSSLSQKHGLIFMEDLGSGMLVDMKEAGLTSDPTVRECLECGVDIVTFSGDKLLGGPQIGGIVGSEAIISKLRKHPLLRALRVDKMTLAAFEATLRLYLKGKEREIPTLAMAFTPPNQLKRKANALCKTLKTFFESTKLNSVSLSVVEVKDTVGGGAFPGSELKGYAVSLKIPELGSTGKLAKRLRTASTPIVTGASLDRLLFHVRTLHNDDEKIILKTFSEFLLTPNERSETL